MAGVSAGDYNLIFDDEQLASRNLTAPTINKVSLSAASHRLPAIELGHAEDGISK